VADAERHLAAPGPAEQLQGDSPAPPGLARPRGPPGFPGSSSSTRLREVTSSRSLSRSISDWPRSRPYTVPVEVSRCRLAGGGAEDGDDSEEPARAQDGTDQELATFADLAPLEGAPAAPTCTSFFDDRHGRPRPARRATRRAQRQVDQVPSSGALVPATPRRPAGSRPAWITPLAAQRGARRTRSATGWTTVCRHQPFGSGSAAGPAGAGRGITSWPEPTHGHDVTGCTLNSSHLGDELPVPAAPRSGRPAEHLADVVAPRTNRRALRPHPRDQSSPAPSLPAQ